MFSIGPLPLRCTTGAHTIADCSYNVKSQEFPQKAWKVSIYKILCLKTTRENDDRVIRIALRLRFFSFLHFCLFARCLFRPFSLPEAGKPQSIPALRVPFPQPTRTLWRRRSKRIKENRKHHPGPTHQTPHSVVLKIWGRMVPPFK